MTVMDYIDGVAGIVTAVFMLVAAVTLLYLAKSQRLTGERLTLLRDLVQLEFAHDCDDAHRWAIIAARLAAGHKLTPDQRADVDRVMYEERAAAGGVLSVRQDGDR